MGYSCSAQAHDTLMKIRDICVKETGKANVFNHKGNSYFWETGRENDDGAITGSINKEITQDGKEMAYQSGTFRIEPDGTITRFMRFKEELGKMRA